MKATDRIIISEKSSIKEAMRVIDKTGIGIAFVVDKNENLLGVISDGDIRGAILDGVGIDKTVEPVYTKNPITVKKTDFKNGVLDFNIEADIKKKIPVSGVVKVPVVDEENRLIDVIFLYENREKKFKTISESADFKPEGIKKVLVIGGAGYLGSVLCRSMLKEGYKVRVLDNLAYGDCGIKGLLENGNFEFNKGDIRNITDITESIRGIDAVIHLAGIVGDPACSKNPRETLEINYLASKSVVEACKYFQINRFIFASTCSVYGRSVLPDKQLAETSLLNPLSLYAESKIKCEEAVLRSADENFSPVILRMATLYGFSPNMRFDLAVNQITAKAVFENKITIFGGDQWRPWLHVDDAARAYIKCVESPLEKIKGEIFNVVSENHKISEVGKIIKSAVPSAEFVLDSSAFDRRDYNVSAGKISSRLNYFPRKKIGDGVCELKGLIESGFIKDYKDVKFRIS